jgi:hypothetical protein
MTTGHCLCGAIQYEYDGEPTLVVHCHCESCRRQTASPVATFVIVPKTALRSFCAECGSPMYYRTERRPDVIDLYLGTLSEPGAIMPQCHVHAVDQLPWFEVLDDLPRYPGSRWADGPIRTGPRR